VVKVVVEVDWVAERAVLTVGLDPVSEVVGVKKVGKKILPRMKVLR
jgi:hypothetical protein